MRIDLAHLREKSTSGGWLSVAVFAAKSNSGNNSALLSQLVARTRASGLRVDKAALTFKQNGRIRFYGDEDLVKLLSQRGSVFQRTHTIDV